MKAMVSRVISTVNRAAANQAHRNSLPIFASHSITAPSTNPAIPRVPQRGTESVFSIDEVSDDEIKVVNPEPNIPADIQALFDNVQKNKEAIALELRDRLLSGRTEIVKYIVTKVLKSRSLDLTDKVEILLCKNNDGVSGFQILLMYKKWKLAKLFLNLVVADEKLDIYDKARIVAIRDTDGIILLVDPILCRGDTEEITEIVTLFLPLVSRKLPLIEVQTTPGMEILLCKNRDGVSWLQMELIENKWDSAEIFLNLIHDYEGILPSSKYIMTLVNNSNCNLANVYNNAIKRYIYFVVKNKGKLSTLLILKLLSLENGCGILGLHQLLKHGCISMVRKLTKLILSCQELSIPQIVDALLSKDKNGVSGLEAAIINNKLKSAKAFLTLICESDRLSPENKKAISKINLPNVENDAKRKFTKFMENNKQFFQHD